MLLNEWKTDSGHVILLHTHTPIYLNIIFDNDGGGQIEIEILEIGNEILFLCLCWCTQTGYTFYLLLFKAILLLLFE